MLENNKDNTRLKLIEKCSTLFNNLAYEFYEMNDTLDRHVNAPEIIIDEFWENARNVMIKAYDEISSLRNDVVMIQSSASMARGKKKEELLLKLQREWDEYERGS
jgi:predicted ATPase